ncbi:MAG: hypothetical protein WD426_18925 [Anditalea sp.]
MITDPEDVAKLFVKAWNENDATDIASLFAEDAQFKTEHFFFCHAKAFPKLDLCLCP